jgi:hypothetical protein
LRRAGGLKEYKKWREGQRKKQGKVHLNMQVQFLVLFLSWTVRQEKMPRPQRAASRWKDRIVLGQLEENGQWQLELRWAEAHTQGCKGWGVVTANKVNVTVPLDISQT